MNTYKVLQYFQCGDLKLEAGQTIVIQPHNPPGNTYVQGASMVSVEHYPEKKSACCH